MPDIVVLINNTFFKQIEYTIKYYNIGSVIVLFYLFVHRIRTLAGKVLLKVITHDLMCTNNVTKSKSINIDLYVK